MDIKTALEKVRKQYNSKLVESHDFKNCFVFVLDTNNDIYLYVCVDKNSGELFYTNFAGLEMMINGKDPTNI